MINNLDLSAPPWSPGFVFLSEEQNKEFVDKTSK